MKPTKSLLAASLVGLAMSAVTGYPTDQAKGNGAEVALQAAIKTEAVDGNLKAAIEQYRKIAEAGSRVVAAKALVRMGQCYEKLGDVEARKAYERVLRDYADQNEAAAQARTRLAVLSGGGSAKSTEMITHRVWSGPDMDPEGRVSPDGRYMTYPDWDTGDLAVFDLVSGEKRRITHKGTWSDNEEFAEFSTPSPDGKQIAYAWYKDGVYELRIIGIDGSNARTVFRNDNVTYMEPMAWSPSGKQIFAAFYQKDNAMQVVSVSVADGSERVFKTLPPRPFIGISLSLSPDGRYLLYDYPQSGNHTHSDIACLSTGESWEETPIEHPADDRVFGWSPDGRSILFISDRTGQPSIWTLELAGCKPTGAPKLLKLDAGYLVPLGVTQKGAAYYGMKAGIREMYTAELDFTSGKLLSLPRPVTELFTGENSSPDWSPDGSRLAYLSVRRRTDRFGMGHPADTIVIRVLATGEEREIAVDPVAVNALWGLRWAPDGRSLAVKGVSNDNNQGVYRVDVETGKQTLLIQENKGYWTFSPQFTPDNKALVCVRRGSSGEGSRIIVRDLETGQERELARRTSPASIRELVLSPDGHQVAFSTSSETGGSSTLNLVPLSGGDTREVLRAQTPDVLGIGDWTPDGRYIVFGWARGDSKDPQSRKTILWKIAPQGGKAEKLDLAMDHIRPLRIHPDGRRVAFGSGSPAWELWVMENFLPVVRAAK